MSQWDFANIQQPQLGNWARSEGILPGLLQLHGMLQASQQQQQGNDYLKANPYEGASNLGALAALKGLAGIQGDQAQTGLTGARTASETGAEGRAADTANWFQQNTGGPAAAAQFGLQQQEGDRAMQALAETGRHNTAEEGLMGQRNTLEQSAQNIGQQNFQRSAGQKDTELGLEGQKVKDEAAYRQQMGDYYSGKDVNGQMTAMSHLPLFMLDPKTGQPNPAGAKFLQDKFGYDVTGGQGPAATPLTDMLMKQMNGGSGQPQPAARTGGLINAAHQGLQNWHENALLGDATGESGFNPLRAGSDAILGTPDRSPASWSPQERQQMMQHISDILSDKPGTGNSGFDPQKLIQIQKQLQGVQ